MSPDPPADPAPLLAAYLARRWSTPTTIAGLRRFHGGSSRETFRFDAVPASGQPRALVLRRDLPSSLIETDRATEFRALELAHVAGIPCPEPVALEIDPAAFGSPGFLMAEIPGAKAVGLLTPEPYGDAAVALGRALFAALGRLHRLDPAGLGVPVPTPDDAWRVRLAHWSAVIDADAQGPEPIVRAALRWLHRHPPPRAQRVAIVHGDFRSGNVLVDAESHLAAIVDWEMVHPGDPLEDLAWCLDPLWAHGSGRPAATLPEVEAIAAWEAASGLVADPAALRWWRVFAQVMGLAIWISSQAEIARGTNLDPVMAFSALYPYRFHNRSLARTLRDLAA